VPQLSRDLSTKKSKTSKSQASHGRRFLFDVDCGQKECRTKSSHFELQSKWTILNLFLVPSLFFTASVLERRKPLSASARRAGWIGCNIVLDNVPPEAKIPLIEDTVIVNPHNVREKYKQFQKLRSIDWELRGWALDVLRVARKIGSREFYLKQLYKYEPELQALYPNNRNVRPKIRQQLQLLRDLSILDFLGDGKYRLKDER